MAGFCPPPLGWVRDLPDPRDWHPRHDQVRELWSSVKRRRSKVAELPKTVDLREFYDDVGSGLPLRWSAARSCVELVQYFERRATGRMPRLSGRFLYKMARRLSHQVGDSGVTLRAALRAARRCGIPPAEYWPDDLGNFDAEPDQALYCFARDYASLHYLRLDTPQMQGEALVQEVKSHLAAGLSLACGTAIPSTISAGPDIAYPTHFDAVGGGETLVLVGYDDARRIRSTRGAFLVRNHWGVQWGERGYGWLPYRYLEAGLATDVWTLLKSEWLASGEFSLPQ